MQDTFLRTDEGQHLRLTIQFDTIPTLVEIRHRHTQLGGSHCHLIAVCIRQLSYLTQFLDGLLRRGHIRTADGKTDDIHAFGIHFCHFLQFAAEVVLLN